MKNAGNFFHLARTQLARATDRAHSNDLVLFGILPQHHMPTGPSVDKRIIGGLVASSLVMEATAAVAYFGYEQPTEVCALFQPHVNRDEAIELRSHLVDNSQVTAPRDAPCRSWPWSVVKRRLSYDRRQAALVHGRLADPLGPYVDRFLGDVRDWLSDEWVRVTDEARLGLSWVMDDSPLPAGDESSDVVLHHLKNEVRVQWHPSAEPWTIDNLVRWAEVCARYVRARREL